MIVAVVSPEHYESMGQSLIISDGSMRGDRVRWCTLEGYKDPEHRITYEYYYRFVFSSHHRNDKVTLKREDI